MDLLRRLEDKVSKSEFLFVLDKIQTRGMPTPKLLIKDHKNLIPKEFIQQDEQYRQLTLLRDYLSWLTSELNWVLRKQE